MTLNKDQARKIAEALKACLAQKGDMSKFNTAMKEVLKEREEENKLSSENRDNLKCGYYVLSEKEKQQLQQNGGNLTFIWNKIGKSNPFARVASGFLPNIEDNTEKSAGCLFVVTDEGMKSVQLAYERENDGTSLMPISAEVALGLKYIGLYANFLAKKNIVKNLTITSTSRTVEKQAEIIYHTTMNGQNMYPYSSKLVRENKHKAKEEVISMLVKHIENIKKVHGYYKGFNHIHSDMTVDITTHPAKGDAYEFNFKAAILAFKIANTVLSNTSLRDGEGDEKGCHHLVFKKT